MAESDLQRSNGEPEAMRRRDGGGETDPLPGSEAARANVSPANKPRDPGQEEHWTPTAGTGGGGDGSDIRPGSPADAAMAGTAPADAPAQPDDDPQSGSGRIPQPGPGETKPHTGADAPSHGSR